MRLVQQARQADGGVTSIAGRRWCNRHCRQKEPAAADSNYKHRGLHPIRWEGFFFLFFAPQSNELGNLSKPTFLRMHCLLPCCPCLKSLHQAWICNFQVKMFNHIFFKGVGWGGGGLGWAQQSELVGVLSPVNHYRI